MVIEIPVHLLKTKNSGDEIRREVAIALYKAGLLPLKNAAKFLGVNIDDFRKLTGNGEFEPAEKDKKRPDSNEDAVFFEMARPMKEGFDFEQILKEQNYKGTSTAKIRKLIRELDIKDDLAEMLAALSR